MPESEETLEELPSIYYAYHTLDNGRGFDIRQKGKKRTGLGRRAVSEILNTMQDENLLTFSRGIIFTPSLPIGTPAAKSFISA